MSETLAPDYAEARRRFLRAAAETGADVITFSHPDAAGPDGGELAIDRAELGPPDAGAALLIVSGTHGVEGFAGSALQTRWLAERARQPLPAGLRVVLVHALNPFGFAWTRRTNEDNVDLNRNFVDWSRPPPANEGYDRLASLLVPHQWDPATRDATTAELLAEAQDIGLAEFQQVVTAGQYRHPGGVFYGGSGPVWSHRWLAEQASAMVGSARRLGIIDLHTGLGPWGHGELIVCAGKATPLYQRAERWWGDVRSMQDGESVSAELVGDWLGRIVDLLPAVEVTAAALEFGTVDPVSVLQALRGEAWLHSSGPADGTMAEAVRSEVRAAFADDDPAWLALLAERFDQVATSAVAQLTG